MNSVRIIEMLDVYSLDFKLSFDILACRSIVVKKYFSKIYSLGV